MTSIKGLCPICGPDKNAQVIAEHQEILEPTEEPFDPTLVGNTHRMLKCKGCDSVYFQRERVNILPNGIGDWDDSAYFQHYVAELKRYEPDKIYDEETSYWPVPSTDRDWLRTISDETLIKHLNSVYKALEHELRVLAAIGMGVVFDRASELLGVDANKNFAEKLDQLHKEGHIGAVDQKALKVLTEARSAAAHRGWEPNVQQLNILASIMEHFVRSNFILKEEAGKLEGAIPRRQKKRPAEDRERKGQLLAFPPAKPLQFKDDLGSEQNKNTPKSASD